MPWNGRERLTQVRCTPPCVARPAYSSIGKSKPAAPFWAGEPRAEDLSFSGPELLLFFGFFSFSNVFFLSFLDFHPHHEMAMVKFRLRFCWSCKQNTVTVDRFILLRSAHTYNDGRSGVPVPRRLGRI